MQKKGNRPVYIFPMANGFDSSGEHCDPFYSLPALKLSVLIFLELRKLGVDVCIVVMNNRVRHPKSGRLLVDLMSLHLKSSLGEDFDQRKFLVTSLPCYGGVMDARSVAHELIKTRYDDSYDGLAETIIVGYSEIIRDYIEIVYLMVAKQCYGFDWEFRYKTPPYLRKESPSSIIRYKLQARVARFVSKASWLLFWPYYFANWLATLPRRRNFTVTVSPDDTV